MAKMKRNKADYIEDILMRSYERFIASQSRQEQSVENSLLEKEEASRCYEQQSLRQRDSDLAYMVVQFQELNKELHKIKKSMNDVKMRVNALEDNSHKLEKKLKGLSEKVDKLWQRSYKQKNALNKYRSQMRLQKKILRLMGAYFGINNSSDNLEKILNKCSKKLDSAYKQFSPRMKMSEIIDADYREVKSNSCK